MEARVYQRLRGGVDSEYFNCNPNNKAMVIEGRKMVCDACKKETTWSEGGGNPSTYHVVDGWYTITIGYDISGNRQKNFCSSDCVKLYLDTQQAIKPMQNKSTESL